MAGTKNVAVQQVTVHLTSDEVEFLRTQATVDGVTFNDVLRRSIGLEKFFVDQQRKKRKIFFGVPGRASQRSDPAVDDHEQANARDRRRTGGSVAGAGNP